MPLKFVLLRVKRIPWNLPQTTTIEMVRKLPEEIILRTEGNSAEFYLEDYPSYYVGNTTLNDSLYIDVYRIPFGSAKVAKYFYFQKGTGLIAVEYLNGELYARK
jgi:hypothetical protein